MRIIELITEENIMTLHTGTGECGSQNHTHKCIIMTRARYFSTDMLFSQLIIVLNFQRKSIEYMIMANWQLQSQSMVPKKSRIEK